MVLPHRSEAEVLAQAIVHLKIATMILCTQNLVKYMHSTMIESSPQLTGSQSCVQLVGPFSRFTRSLSRGARVYSKSFRGTSKIHFVSHFSNERESIENLRRSMNIDPGWVPSLWMSLTFSDLRRNAARLNARSPDPPR